MRCPIESRDSTDLLLAYQAGRLDAETGAMVEQHIQVCPACREIARGQQAVWQALDAWEAPPVSADFDRRLYQRMEQPRSWWHVFRLDWLFRQGLPVAAAAGLLIVAGLLLEHPAKVPAPSPVSAQVDVVAPDQADHALQEMEMMREFDRLVHPDAAEPKM